MALKANLSVDQGADYETSITLTDSNGTALDLTGYTGAAQIRKYYTSSNATNFTVSITANTGLVELSLTSNTTNSMAGGRYVYDVEMTDSGGTVSRVLEGILTVKPGVTQI